MKKLAKNIRRVGLIANTAKPGCRTLVRRAAALIAQAGRTALLDQPTARLTGLSLTTCPDAAALAKSVDLLMVFGGDGTMLRVGRAVAGSRTPILGINAGGLGFLTDVPSSHLPQALSQVWEGKTVLESRSMIQASGRAQNQPYSRVAFNDFVISRGATPRLIELEVRIDGVVLTQYRCDGLIVCSPTGSTAYSLAAGGAVISPTADVLSLTPICPHTLSNRSVVVGRRSVIQVRVLSPLGETILTADGQIPQPVRAGDIITLRRSRHVLQLLHLAGSSFFDTLRQKLNWSGSAVSQPPKS